VNILLTRLDRIGDLILSTPAIASVRRSWPDAHIALACTPHNAVVVERNKDIDELVICEAAAAARTLGPCFRGGTDLAIALAPRSADFALVGATRAPRRVGYTYVRRYVARLTARRYLTDLAVSEADPELAERDGGYVVRHEVDQVLALVALAGGTARARDLVVDVDERDRAQVAGVPAGGIAFQLAPRWLSDGSTADSTIALLRNLRAFGVPIVATYGADSVELADLVRVAGAADAVIGDLPFGAWAAVFEKSAAVVTVDTGATHVASAMRRPTVVLFEHRYFNLNSQEWSPYGVPSACLRKPERSDEATLAAMREEIVAAVGTLLALP
jgi:ADP-heptose:LPS heptosyltransferase